MAAGDYCTAFTFIEGNRIADLQWGTPAAKYAMLRFAARSSAISNKPFNVSIRNLPVTHSFVYSLTTGIINVWTEYSLVVPPCTVGTWATDNNVGLMLGFCSLVGSTYQAPSAGVWTAGNFLGTLTSTSVYSGSLGMEVTEIGFHADPNMTGVAPEFQCVHIEDDLQDAMRYFQKHYRMDGVVNSATNGYVWTQLYVPMRAVPNRTIVGSPRTHDISVAAVPSAISNYNTTTESSSVLLTGSGYTVGRPFRTLVDGQVANYIAHDARM